MSSLESRRGMTIVEEGISRTSIFLGENPTEIEQHAAKELRKYIKVMSKADLWVFKGFKGGSSTESEWLKAQDRKDNVILIGRSKTNSKIEELCNRGLVKLSCDYPGLDGFVIKTVADKAVGNRYYLVFGGNTDRATLYAVYHFLENVCKCGFFEDGDYIPKKQTIPIPHLDITERPYFPYRQNLQECPLTYSTAYWNWEDWKKELDWMAKKKFNIVSYPFLMPKKILMPKKKFNIVLYYPYLFDSSTSNDPAWQRTWKILGLREQGEPNIRTYEFRLAKQTIDYARKLGMKVISPGFCGAVPREFKKVYPRCQYLEIKWREGVPSVLNLNPVDPMFSRVLSTFIKEYNNIYGTDHIYSLAPYSEATAENNPEKNRQIKVNFAKAAVRGIKDADPEGIWYMFGWTFVLPQWSKEEVKDFLEVIPNDMFYVCDIWADEKPQYKRLDYFYGKRWGFSILHAFGGNTALHGDLKDIIKRLKDLSNDSQAENCQYFYLNPEIVYHNFLYYDLVTKLGWDPRKVNLDDFLRDYSARRYGEESTENMLKALQELEQSVYSTNDLISPQYQFPVGVHKVRAFTYNQENLERRFPFLLHLRNALNFALRESERQKENPLYQTDILDMLRQYLGELFNYHFIKFNNAFHKNHKENIKEEANIMEELLNKQALLLSTHKDYCLSTEIEKAKKRPGENYHVDRIIKARVSYLGLNTGCSWNEDPLFLLDYARKDLFELVKFYYHPRVHLYIKTVKNAVEKGLPTLPKSELKKGYKRIAKTFIDEPLKIKGEDKYTGTTLQIAKEIFPLFSLRDFRKKTENFLGGEKSITW